MEDGEIVVSDHEFFRNSNSSVNLQPSMSMDSFLDNLLKNSRTCTHTHTCNPPGPEAAHTHTCYHTHTKVLQSEDDDGSHHKPKRPSGNREAVRKYREKKKAHTAYLEEEVEKLRLVNQQLVRKLQGQSVLEAEVLRLRSLLVDIRGKIDSELGVFPQKHSNFTANSTKAGRCGDTSVCGSGKTVGFCEGINEPAIVDCQAEMNNNADGEANAAQAE